MRKKATKSAKPARAAKAKARTSAHGASQSQAEKAFLKLEELIVKLKLEPGSIWTEAKLSDMLNIGRTPVREAVLRLANYQVVEIVQRFGIRISEINEREQLLVLETRRELDRLIAVQAARRATATQRQELERMAETLRKIGKKEDVAEFVRLFFVMKRFLAQCARNRFAEQAVVPLYIFSHRFYAQHHSLDDLGLVADLHADLVSAVAKGDIEKAASFADKQLDYADMLTKRAIMRDL